MSNRETKASDALVPSNKHKTISFALPMQFPGKPTDLFQTSPSDKLPAKTLEFAKPTLFRDRLYENPYIPPLQVDSYFIQS